MTDKQLKHYREMGFPEKIIQETVDFLKNNQYTLVNLAVIDNNTYRIMFRQPDGKVQAELFPC